MDRYRFLEDGPYTEKETCEHWHAPANGDPPYIGSTEVQDPTKLTYKRTEGENTPDFHKRKARGDLLPFTRFAQYEDKRGGSGSYYRRDNVGDIGTWYSASFPPPAGKFCGGGRNELIAQARNYPAWPYVQRAASQIYSSGWDALTFLAEYRETYNMFRNLGFNLIRAYKRGTRTKEWDNKWLETRYGFRTLIYDIQDLMEALSNLGESMERFKERQGLTHNWSEPLVSEVTDVGYGILTRETTVDWTLSVRGSVVADIRPPTFGFNPLTTGWEVVKLSFVLDWFVNIGQALEATSFLALATGYTAAGGHYVERSARTQWFTEPAPGWTATSSRTSFRNEVLSLREPSKISILPHLDVRLNVDKVRDILSLLNQAR